MTPCTLNPSKPSLRSVDFRQTVSNCNSYGSLTASTSKNKCHAVTFFRRPLKKRRTIYASAAHNSQENKPFAVKTEEGARGSPPPLRVESHTTPCYLFNTTKFENGDVAYLQSSLSARGALTLDTRFEEEPVPSPPPLIRVEGQPTVFNTYAQGVHYTKELVFSTATGLLASPLEAPAKDVKQTGLLSWCEDTKPSLATEKAADVSQLIDEFKRAENNTSCVTEELATIDTEVQPKVAVDTVEHARLAKVTIPASLMTGKLISTAHGLAMLLIPNENMSAADFSTFASAVTNPSIGSAGTKCKHWTKAEDELLKFATSNEGGPPYNWTEIGRNYFPATRSANQVCLAT